MVLSQGHCPPTFRVRATHIKISLHQISLTFLCNLDRGCHGNGVKLEVHVAVVVIRRARVLTYILWLYVYYHEGALHVNLRPDRVISWFNTPVKLERFRKEEKAMLWLRLPE